MVRIQFRDLTIDRIAHASGVFSGDNAPCHWKHRAKTNEGFGAVSGDKNISIGNRSLLNDQDICEHKTGAPRETDTR
ncbi:hypothetical protein LOK74_03150 [Brevibacillus humidisoli]|uniref:hypothetical protein n=1 Tax=Brevibacillus humidisoli TaxID=2895522 RepID=UPI001E448F45|nr:hypothetical protein [Brevibacillus humidisoli]UFJ41545.1 hypothetical protein LOK74_03150 [Brevibacillus humidisoli]